MNNAEITAFVEEYNTIKTARNRARNAYTESSAKAQFANSTDIREEAEKAAEESKQQWKEEQSKLEAARGGPGSVDE